MLIHRWIYSWKIMILQILESFNSKCSKSNLFKYLKMSSMKFICPIAALTNPIFTFILDQILIHQLITKIGLYGCPQIVRCRFWLRFSSVSGTNKVLVSNNYGHLRKLIRLKFFTNILSSLITSILQISSYLIFIKSSFRIKTEISIKHFRFEKP